MVVALDEVDGHTLEILRREGLMQSGVAVPNFVGLGRRSA
jgi:hypothetical protein